jgi:Ca2+-transporting ATPase
MTTATAPEDWYRLSAGDAGVILESGEAGLTTAEAEARLARNGPNELEERGGRSRWQILLTQFTSFLTIVLIVAAVISLALGDWLDALVIMAIVVLNAGLGYYQEHKAEAAMAALKQMAVPLVRVRRDGQVVELAARELVIGDVVVLETGNVVSADGRLISASNLRVDEAPLTGESEPVGKEAEMVFATERAIGDRRNMLFMGTTVTMGRAELLVTETGMDTQLGLIAEMIQSVEDEQTPLQRRLDHLGKVLAGVAFIIVAIVFVLGMVRGEDFETMLLTAVSLAVAAIPEAMPAVVTIALSLGAQRMLKRNALIRRLPAVETLGSVTVICSDKTGTLTENRMTVTVLDVADHRVELTDPGRVRSDHESDTDLRPTLDLALVAGALCTDAVLTETDDGYTAIGDPTEGALVVSAATFGLHKEELEHLLPRVLEAPFDSTRKRMTTVHRLPEDTAGLPHSLREIWDRTEAAPELVGLTKGAVEGLIGVSSSVWANGRVQPLDEAWRQRVHRAEEELAGDGMRVLGVAVRRWDEEPPDQSPETLERDLVIVGMFGLIDPARPEVPPAVATCKAAGIRPVMITGDHPLTARNVAREIGITHDETFLIGSDIDAIDHTELRAVAEDVSVFARVSPEHKLELISAYQENDQLVAMTGDGVNDAPALKKADIGVAMGITGTDVSKEASDMVLLDDNFATIVAAVEEGRVIYDNIRKFIKYLLTCNASELAVMIVGPFLGMPLPLLPLQILWMNLITDGLPALALGVEPPEHDVMDRPPRSASETIFGGGVVPYIVGFGTMMAIISLAVGYGYWKGDIEHWQTMLFTTLIFAQLGLGLGVRSEKLSLFSIGLWSNRAMVAAVTIGIALQLVLIYVPVFQRVFDTDPLPALDLAVAFLAGGLMIVGVEIQKWVVRRRDAAALQSQHA